MIIRAAVFILDVLLACVAAAIVAIAVTGGGSVELGDRTVTAHSLRNPFVWFAGLLLIRLLVRRAGPCSAALRLLNRLVTKLSSARPSDTWLVCYVVCALVLVTRLVLAWNHPGFFSGDDVEVQEMSFARLFAWEWQAWDLRSPFFPITVVYPIQAAAHALGVSDPAHLVFAGRAAIAILSTLALPVLATCVLRGSAPIAILAMVALASSSLWVHFGSTELPRPLSAVLLLAAFCALTRQGARPALLAGAALGVAACLRFSEGVFVVAVACQLLFERRFRDLAVTVTTSLIVATGIQGASDYLYWGTAFHSLNAIVDYTLVDRLSSRGYEPWWYYVTEIGTWTDWVVLGLAAWGARQRWRPAIWVVIPVVLLSVMPHHEPRYLIPVMPFVAILAATGLWDLCLRIQQAGTEVKSTASAGLAVIGLCTLVLGSMVYQLSVQPVPRHDTAVRLASALKAEIGGGLVVIEEPWRWGSHLYLGGSARLDDLVTNGIGSGVALRTEIQRRGGDWVALRRDTCSRLDCGPALSSLGYVLREARAGDPHDYIVFKR